MPKDFYFYAVRTGRVSGGISGQIAARCPVLACAAQRAKERIQTFSFGEKTGTVIGDRRFGIQNRDDFFPPRIGFGNRKGIRDKRRKSAGFGHLAESVLFVHEQKMRMWQFFPAHVVPETDFRIQQEILSVDIAEADGGICFFLLIS